MPIQARYPRLPPVGGRDLSGRGEVRSVAELRSRKPSPQFNTDPPVPKGFDMLQSRQPVLRRFWNPVLPSTQMANKPVGLTYFNHRS